MIDVYLRGLAARAESWPRLDTVSSVASVFLSRIDAEADQRLPEGSPLRGRVALAWARVSPQRSLPNFAGPRWARLEGLGARRQRPFWASTGTKNPDYSDALRLGDDRRGRREHMLEHTRRAFADHGEVKPTLEADPASAQRMLADAAAAGIDLASVTTALGRRCTASRRLRRVGQSRRSAHAAEGLERP